MEGFYKGQCAVLEGIASGAPLSTSLDGIVRLIERESAMACSILLLDADGTHVRHGAAPSLPADYVRVLDGLAIGPEAGSCGAAAFHRERVIVEDIATHPNWAPYRDLALPHGLRACWSTPIIDEAGVLLGTFAMYYREPRGPTAQEEELVAAATHLATIAIVRERTTRALVERGEALRRQLEELHASEDRLRSIIENTPDVAIQWYTADGRLTFCNAASLRLFGWTREAVLGKRLVELGFFDAAEERRFADARAAAASGHPPPPVFFEFTRPDGSRGYLLSTVFQIPFGDEPCFVCMDVDLTERRRMEEAVRAGEALRAIIYANVLDPIFCIAAEEGDRFRFLSINPAFARATGLAESDVVGKEIGDVIPEPSCTLVRAKYREALDSGSSVQWEEVTPYPTGVRHGIITVRPTEHPAGRRTIVGTVHDITELRRAEDERRALEAQLQQNQRLQALGTLASGVAHDFNNILAAISSNAELAADLDDVPDEARRSLEDIRQATKRAAALVRQILAYSRKQEARKERVSVPAVLDEVVGLLRATIPSRIQIATSFPSTPLVTELDPTQLHQTVMNLVTNAAQAIEGRGTIQLAAARYEHTRPQALDLPEGAYVRISVTDTGRGMDEATLARVFDPFFTTKPGGEGTGLGLSIVHQIVRAHGGAVTVRSRVGEGTTFDLYYPLVADHAAAPIATGARIMLVDGEEAYLFLARRILTRLGYRVTVYANPHRALEELRAAPDQVDAVIADTAMATMSGIALLSEARRLRPGIAVLLVARYVRQEDILAARAHGLGDPIPKPHTPDELAWVVSRRLQG